MPERISIARLLVFNAVDLEKFYTKLKSILQSYPQFGDGSTYNLDETGVTIVSSKSSKVLAVVGTKDVSTVSEAKRGPLITACCIISANGN